MFFGIGQTPLCKNWKQSGKSRAVNNLPFAIYCYQKSQVRRSTLTLWPIAPNIWINTETTASTLKCRHI